MQREKILLVIVLLLSVALCFVKCMDQPSFNDARGNLYAGAATCVTCHKNIAESYVHNSHYKTSSIPSTDSIKKWLAVSNRAVDFPNGESIQLTEKDAFMLQAHMKQQQELRSEKMDFAFGSGEKAVTFGYWKDEQMLQLPLTYLSQLQLWTNSPGFPVDKPYFTRAIITRCFECHSSYAQSYNENTQPMQLVEKIKPNSIVMGIDCERCHGPAATHVQFHQQHPEEKSAKFMTAIATLNRQQKLDMCATCHSGNPVSLQSIFNFKPGDNISNYYMYYPGAALEPDVHGMQLQLLQKSACFKQSTLTCITCHNSHQQEDNNQTIFTAACASCHQQSAHVTQMAADKKYCVSCHMPMRASKSLDFNNSTENKSIPYKLRTHRIAVYPQSEWDQ